MNKLADSLQFILLYPDQPLYNNLLTAFAFYSPRKMKVGQGENASIRQMIEYCLQNYPIDRERIYIWGMSAGAAMTNVMLNAYPDIFAAGAMLAPPSQLHEGINPKRQIKPRIAIIQGEQDHTVSPEHANKVQQQWETYLELDPKNKVVENNYRGHSDLSLTHYKNDLDNYLVRLNIANTGHLLLVDPGETLNQGGKKCIYSKDIDFHLPYWICEFFGLTE